MRLHEKVCLITGAASGLGLATARVFASEGARLCLIDWNASGLHAARETLEMQGRDRVLALPGDVSSPPVVESLIATATNHFGRVDVLFNNAGIDPVRASTVTKTALSDWDAILNVNLRAPFMLCRLCLPIMVKNGGGVIINIGSSAGLKPTIGQAAYSVSKAAVIALTKSIAVEYSGSGVRANCICPGFLESAMSDRRRDLTDTQVRARRRNVVEKVPMRRAGEYAETARVALFLACNDSSYMSGAVVPVDGGWLAT